MLKSKNKQDIRFLEYSFLYLIRPTNKKCYSENRSFYFLFIYVFYFLPPNLSQNTFVNVFPICFDPRRKTCYFSLEPSRECSDETSKLGNTIGIKVSTKVCLPNIQKCKKVSQQFHPKMQLLTQTSYLESQVEKLINVFFVISEFVFHFKKANQ